MLIDNGLCFGCGPENPIGLHLTFDWNGDRYETHWTPAREHQGWADRVHGGLLTLVLDEVLSRAALTRHEGDWVTAELTTRLLRPARTGEPLTISAQILSVRTRLIVCDGEIRRGADGALVATGQAKLMRSPENSGQAKAGAKDA